MESKNIQPIISDVVLRIIKEGDKEIRRARLLEEARRLRDNRDLIINHPCPYSDNVSFKLRLGRGVLNG